MLYVKDLYFKTIRLACHIGYVGLQDSAQLSQTLSSVNRTSSKLLAPLTQTPPPVYRTYRYYTGMKGIAPNDTPPSSPGPSRVGGGVGVRNVSYPGPRSVGGAPRSLGGEAACRGPRE